MLVAVPPNSRPEADRKRITGSDDRPPRELDGHRDRGPAETLAEPLSPGVNDSGLVLERAFKRDPRDGYARGFQDFLERIASPRVRTTPSPRPTSSRFHSRGSKQKRTGARGPSERERRTFLTRESAGIRRDVLPVVQQIQQAFLAQRLQR